MGTGYTAARNEVTFSMISSPPSARTECEVSGRVIKVAFGIEAIELCRLVDESSSQVSRLKIDTTVTVLATAVAKTSFEASFPSQP